MQIDIIKAAEIIGGFLVAVFRLVEQLEENNTEIKAFESRGT